MIAIFPEIQRAVTLDEQSEANVVQDHNIYDGNYESVSDDSSIDPDTGEILANAPFERQVELILTQIKKVLETAGSDLDRVVAGEPAVRDGIAGRAEVALHGTSPKGDARRDAHARAHRHRRGPCNRGPARSRCRRGGVPRSCRGGP